MSKQIDALKLALEALEEFGKHYDWCHQFPTYAFPENYPPCNCGYDEAITAIKEALNSPNGEAQPEQHQDWCASLTQLLMSMPPKPAPCNCKPPQRIWVGLTPQERDEINQQVFGIVPHYVAFHHALEAKLKQKNGYDS